MKYKDEVVEMRYKQSEVQHLAIAFQKYTQEGGLNRARKYQEKGEWPEVRGGQVIEKECNLKGRHHEVRPAR